MEPVPNIVKLCLRYLVSSHLTPIFGSAVIGHIVSTSCAKREKNKTQTQNEGNKDENTKIPSNFQNKIDAVML